MRALFTKPNSFLWKVATNLCSENDQYVSIVACKSIANRFGTNLKELNAKLILPYLIVSPSKWVHLTVIKVRWNLSGRRMEVCSTVLKAVYRFICLFDAVDMTYHEWYSWFYENTSRNSDFVLMRKVCQSERETVRFTEWNVCEFYQNESVTECQSDWARAWQKSLTAEHTQSVVQSAWKIPSVRFDWQS